MTARLVPVNDIAGNREIQLTKPDITIGRSRQCDLQLEDPSVSRIHARISISDGIYVIEDNGSLHGTKVNGKPITSQRLAHDDVIQFGVYS